jgi:hypothetical protein
MGAYSAGTKKNTKKCNKKKKIEDLFDFDLTDDFILDSIVPEPIDPGETKYIRLPFPPFYHYRLDENKQPYLVGKSHWKGDLEKGEFCKDHGTVTRTLATMYIKLCERYATRSNWRGYCVDTATEALTQRGWLGIDQITESDVILSYNQGDLTWSSIKSIYRGEFDGLMHKLSSRSIDSLITPNHKLVTERGLVPVEYILEKDRIVVMGNPEAGSTEKHYSDSFVELAGWIVTEGCYDVNRENGKIRSIAIYQNAGSKADRIRNCLINLDYKFSESFRSKNNIAFNILREDSKKLIEIFPTKNLTMDFILKLTKHQRELLIETMIDGDGWRRANGNRSYVQKDLNHVNLFQALCAVAGHKTNAHYIDNHISYGKLTNYYSINLFSNRGNVTNGSCIDFNGGKRNGRKCVGQGKASHPNVPTVYYKGMVWCPETEYGSFIARRNGKVYLTGNTYNEEMRGAALVQLTQIGLRFDESKSQNPFAYYTAAITNSFTHVLNSEKKNQNIRDDLLEHHGLTPSWTRQNSGKKEAHASGPVRIIPVEDYGKE